MFEFLCILIGIVLAGAALYAFVQTRDAFHPMIVVTPLFMYSYCVWPIALNLEGGLEWYVDRSDLIYVAVLYLLTLTAFVAGALKIPSALRHSRAGAFDLWNLQLPEVTRRRLYGLSIFLGLISVAAYWYMLDNVGGFVAAYSKVKGGGHAESGYIGEAVLLSFPAILLLALSLKGTAKIRLTDMALALLIASPHLLQGTFGGRRGPLFLVLVLLLFAWFIARGRKPSIKSIVAGISIIGLFVILVWSQRQHLYIGSEGEIESGSFIEKIVPDKVEPGNTYLFGVGSILTVDYFGDYFWGHRFFVTFVIRPIPKQIWPTKYEDMGATWVMGLDEASKDAHYEEAAGFLSPNGSAMPSVADGYLEFSWGVIILFYLVGRSFATTWARHRTRGGLWTLLLMVMLALSIYLATQSVSAWLHRLLFMAVPTALLWKYWIARGSTATQPAALAARG